MTVSLRNNEGVVRQQRGLPRSREHIPDGSVIFDPSLPFAVLMDIE